MDEDYYVVKYFSCFNNFMGWDDVMVLVDWSGFCFMMELEFIKVCCGFEFFFVIQYFWGSVSKVNVDRIVNLEDNLVL